MKIGVFDSGVGGLSVAYAIKQALPELEIELREDREHVPYGTRTPDEVFEFVVPILEDLVADGCEVIVIACNTVSTTLIGRLREHFTVSLIAVEPMVRTAAALTKSGVIAVCATPATLASDRYQYLKTEFAAAITVLEPDCSDWAMMIENDTIDKAKLRDRIETVLNQGADVVVLGCTHYHWIEEDIVVITADRAAVIHPEAAIIEQLKRVLAQL